MNFIDKEIESDFWDKETLVSELKITDKRKIRVTVCENENGSSKISIREFVLKGDNGFIATRKGMTIDTGMLTDLQEVLMHIQKEYVK